MNIYQKVEKKLKQGQRFLIGSHVNPDGDAIGSTLALGAVLKHLGKEVVMYNRDPVPDNLNFLKGTEQIVQDISSSPFDMAIMIDCASKDRAGEPFVKAQVKGLTLAIDHHRLDSAEVDL